MSTKDSGSKSKNKSLFIMIVFGVILLAGAAGIWFMATSDSRNSEPLSLSSGEAIWGRFEVDPGPFTIGDRIPVTVEIEAQTGVKYEFPDLAKNDLGPLEILEAPAQNLPVKREVFPEGYRQTVQYLITPWRVGRWPLPPITVSYEDPAGNPGTYQIPGQTIIIVSVLPPKKDSAQLTKLDIKGVKSPLGFPPRYRFLFWYLLGPLLAAVIIWRRAAYLRKQRNQAPPPEPELPPEPAHIIAFRRLEALKNSNYLEGDAYLAFYTELSECIREYMENRFQINALEMTTEEFLNFLTRKSDCLTKAQQTVLRDFLNTSDLVKFAKQRPAPEDLHRSLAEIDRLIEETREVESEEAQVAS